MILASELAQWAAIFALGVMVVGLTRQLGAFLLPHRDQLTQSGPQPGSLLRSPLITPEEQTEIKAAMTRLSAASGVMLIVDQNCMGCRDLIDDLNELASRERRMPLVGLVKGSGVRFVADAHRVFDVVIEDPESVRVRAADIVAAPHALTFDRALKVENVEVASMIAPHVPTWFKPSARSSSEDIEKAMSISWHSTSSNGESALT
jgi:hypothetical protein